MKSLSSIEPSSTGAPQGAPAQAAERFLGIDLGAETLKLVEVLRDPAGIRLGRFEIIEHAKKPGAALLQALASWNWAGISGAAVSGRFGSQIKLPRIPVKQAQLKGYHFLMGKRPATIVNVGSHGFSVLEVRADGVSVFRENSRCSQGTGNFLRQLVERFSLTVEEASRICADVCDPAPLSGRCPVILKTDMTHLANKGEDRPRILAGLFDAVCENILVLLKPGCSPANVLLIGGVSQSQRVRRIFADRLAQHQMKLLDLEPPRSLCLEALGCALCAAETTKEPSTRQRPPATLVSLEELLLPPRPLQVERLAPLVEAIPLVRRMPAQAWPQINGEFRRVVLGFDIGSTGAKLIALDLHSKEILWEGYRQTLGEPVEAAQDLLRRFTQSPASKFPIAAFGATGSGREIVGSLLTSCYGKEAVFVVNEIVAHATGARHYDERVDTIFEIGGQDAKYIRLADGAIVDCAMNEACSAGTGSFIEEQGRKFAGISDVRALGQAALEASFGVSLGQHCSVFMAEVIDEAVGAGIPQPAIISGLYDSIVKNYLNRVKGNRSVGKVIFCQGMPFSADALAAAVARQTGSEVIVPPNPGTVGALGIALLAARELKPMSCQGLPVPSFLNARVEQKDTFICGSNRGCGGTGNHCRIDRLRTRVDSQRALFTWGGGCSLHDKATRKKKLPDLAPNPFRERTELLHKLVAPLLVTCGRPKIVLADEFMLKGLFPFFAGFLHEAGFALEMPPEPGQETLTRGIQSANAPFCAPMQLFHGLVDEMARKAADWMFVPMLRNLPRDNGQSCSAVCPIVQGAPDLVHCALNAGANRSSRPRLLAPRIDFGHGGLESEEFTACCRRLGRTLGLNRRHCTRAWQAGLRLQREFDSGCEQLGRRALEFCKHNQIVPVVVLGRDYTIYNRVLNSNVPAILREQGAVGIPVDCLPIAPGTPHFRDMFWGYGQAILRAAHQIRRTRGLYGIYCSNYSCGPDSFNLHFAAYIMEGKPFAVVETDGHSGDAGTKTRVEAFLHCIEADQRRADTEPSSDFASLQFSGLRLRSIGRSNGAAEHLLIPALGPGSAAVAAVFRGLGLQAERLPEPDEQAMRLGRRYTSGKECLPMPLTLGSLLQRLERARDGERFIYVMPSTDGPCRFGVYNLLNQIVLDRLGWRDRVRIWSPKDSGYFDDLPPGSEMLMLAGIVATDFLLQARFDVRPVEHTPGAADTLYQRYLTELVARLEIAGREDLSLGPALWQVACRNLFGIRDLLDKAGDEFAKLRGEQRLPLVEIAGEIYVRAVPFANDFLAEKLEARGLRVRLASGVEWIAYCSYLRRRRPGRNRLADGFSEYLQHRIERIARDAMGAHFAWPTPPSITEVLGEAKVYLNDGLEGEAVVTLGGALARWRRRELDAVVNLGPLECMPTKLAQAQFHHLAEHHGLLSLTLSFNGDPISTDILDNFAYEVRSRFDRPTGSPPR
jgi:predicted CoA-substrate-specific enzyme activase